MFGSAILDVGIGLILIYLILGLVCTSVNEYIAQILSLRAEFLYRAIVGLFRKSDKAKDFADAIYSHELIEALSLPESVDRPSYIPSHLFSLALADNLGMGDDNPASKTETISKRLQAADVDENIKKTLSPLAAAAGNSVDQFRLNVESWFDASMDRASGWYKRQVQKTIFWVAMFIVLLMNVDTLMVVDTLWKNPTQRTALAAAAEDLAKKSSAAQPSAETKAKEQDPLLRIDPDALKSANTQVESLIGWSGPISWNAADYDRDEPHRFPNGAFPWLYKLLGLLITAFAASLGAPFWFDLLNKIISVRASGKAPDEKSKAATSQPKQERIATGTPQAENASAAADKPAGDKK